MATSGQLVEGVSGATGFAEETVVVHMRNLREAGCITVRGRGLWATKMTAHEAAKLLIAVHGSDYVKDSVNALTSFAPLSAYHREVVSPAERTVPVTIVPHWTDGPRHWSVGYPLISGLNGEIVKKRFGLSRIAMGATFEEALVAIIEYALADTLFPPLRSSDFRRAPAKIPSYRSRLWVSLYRPQPYASITYLAEGIIYEKILFQPKSHGPSLFKDTYKRKKEAVSYRASDFNERSLEIICETLRE